MQQGVEPIEFATPPPEAELTPFTTWIYGLLARLGHPVLANVGETAAEVFLPPGMSRLGVRRVLSLIVRARSTAEAAQEQHRQYERDLRSGKGSTALLAPDEPSGWGVDPGDGEG